MRPEIDPAPTPEEAAAIVAALESFGEGNPDAKQGAPGRGRWEVAGRLGGPLPREIQLEGALWPLANQGRSL